MQPRNIFVGLIAIAAGLSLIAIGVVNVQWYFRSWKMRWLDQRLGRSGIRLIVGLLGILLILLGIAIMGGFAPNAPQEQSCRPTETIVRGLLAMEFASGCLPRI